MAYSFRCIGLKLPEHHNYNSNTIIISIKRIERKNATKMWLYLEHSELREAIALKRCYHVFMTDDVTAVIHPHAKTICNSETLALAVNGSLRV